TSSVQARALIAKVQADPRLLASAFLFYSAHDHRDLHPFPTRRSSDLNAQGQVAGPFMSGTVATPTGWSPTYAYNLSLAAGTFNRSEAHTPEPQSRRELV